MHVNVVNGGDAIESWREEFGVFKAQHLADFNNLDEGKFLKQINCNKIEV